MSLAAHRLGKATLSDVKAWNKLADPATSTAEMGIAIPCGVVNVKTCSVICHADAAVANAEGEKFQGVLVIGLSYHPELVTTGRFDLSTRSTTIRRVVRSTLAAQGYAVSEGLESAQWFGHLLTAAYVARSYLTDVEMESLKRPALVFTDSDSLANTVKKDVGQSHDKRFRIERLCSEKSSDQWREHFAGVVADSFASRRSHDEDNGEGHACRVLQLTLLETREMSFESLPAEFDGTGSLFFFGERQSLSHNLVEFLY